MRYFAALLMILWASMAYAVDTVAIDRDGVTTPTPLSFQSPVTAPSFVSNAPDGSHDILCSNSGEMDTTKDSMAAAIPNSTAWGTADAGRYCYNKATGKFRYWTGSALADWTGSGGGGGTWGSITGALANQTDLNTALSGKQAALGFTPLSPANNLSELVNKTTALTNLGAAAAVGNQDIEITDASKGFITTSPNGNRYRLTVANDGTWGYALVSGLLAPSTVTALGGNASNTISWSGGSGASSYNLLWDTTSHASSGTYTNTIAGITSPYTHASLSNGTTYYYKVRAVNGANNADSAEVSAAPSLYVFNDEFAGANGSAYSLTNWQAAKVQTDGTVTSGSYVNIQNNALKFHQAFASGTYYGNHIVSANSYATASVHSVEVSVTGMATDGASGQSNLINVYGAGCTIGSNGSIDKDYLSLRFGPGTASDGKVTLLLSNTDDTGAGSHVDLNTNITVDANPHVYKIVFGAGTATVYMDGVQQGSPYTHNVTWGADMRFGMTYFAYGVSANVFQDYSVDYFRVQ